MGGGARGAYQAGVLRGLAEFWPHKKIPFSVISGISAGTINASILASRATDFAVGTKTLWDLWAGLNPEIVFRLRREAAIYNGLQWLMSFALSLFRTNTFRPILDTAPLNDFLKEQLDFKMIKEHIRSGVLDAIAFSATDYTRGHSVTFFDGEPELSSWHRNDRLGVRTNLSPRHIVASCAIPILFEPVFIQGRFFGDGSRKRTQ
jgi:NTE family protein